LINMLKKIPNIPNLSWVMRVDSYSWHSCEPIECDLRQNIMARYMYKFEITHEQLEQFAKTKLTLVRYPGIEEEYLDLDFTKLFTRKYATKFLEGAKCILKHIPKEK